MYTLPYTEELLGIPNVLGFGVRLLLVSLSEKLLEGNLNTAIALSNQYLFLALGTFGGFDLQQSLTSNPQAQMIQSVPAHTVTMIVPDQPGPDTITAGIALTPSISSL